MSAEQQFENLECWKLARQLTNSIYDFTRGDKVKKDFAYVDQIRRASVSIMNNISEGHERGSNKDFIKFLYIARGSAGEVRNMLYIGQDQGYLDKPAFEELMDLVIQISKVCYGLIRYLSKNLDWKSKISIALFLLLIPFLHHGNISLAT